MGKKIVVDPVTRIEGHLKITVEVEDGKLTISAKGSKKSEDIVYSEINNTADIERSFLLAENVDTESISASFKDGLLLLSIKKVEAKKPQKIKIK